MEYVVGWHLNLLLLLSSSSFFQALNFLVESFGLLNDLFPLPSILDAGYPVFFIFIWQMSCVMLSSHLYLGLPCDLLVRGFQLNIFLTVLVSGIRCTWPNHLSLWALMWLIIFLCFISYFNSSLVLTLHIWVSFMSPNILLKIFVSKIYDYCHYYKLNFTLTL